MVESIMDKVFALIVLIVICFWGFLKYAEGGSDWVAMQNGVNLGNYTSYSECIEGVKLKGEINTSYSCSLSEK